MVHRLSQSQQQELDGAHPRDLQIARWYSVLYVAGLALAAWFLVVYFLPATFRLFSWMLETVLQRRC